MGTAIEHHQRIKKGLCYGCGTFPPVCGKKRCERCAKAHSAHQKQRAVANVAKGLCVVCGQDKYLESLKNAGLYHRFCETCYFKKVAKRRFGASSLWQAAKEQFVKQDGRCAYTGILLILGVNDSLDHIKPLHHYPHLRSDPSNIEWVCREINEMKRDRTPEEFLALIRIILAYRGQ